MSRVIVVIGTGSVGQAIARRIAPGAHLLVTDVGQADADAAGVSAGQASIEQILHVDLYGTALELEEFGRVIAPAAPAWSSPPSPGAGSRRMLELAPPAEPVPPTKSRMSGSCCSSIRRNAARFAAEGE